MAKKLTKKQLKEIKDKESLIREARRNFVESVKEYWKDVEATTRYYKINGMTDKIDYYGRLKDNDELQNLLNKYSSLDGIKVNYENDDPERHTWSIINAIIKTFDHNSIFGRSILNDDSKFEKLLENDDLYFEDILWGEEDIDLLIKYMKKLGYKRIQYFCHSSGVNEDLYYLINRGCKVVDTNLILRKSFSSKEYKVEKTGLIIEIGE